MYILRHKKVFLAVCPILNPGNEEETAFPVCVGWTYEEAEAAHFTTFYHARAIAKKLGRFGKLVVRHV